MATFFTIKGLHSENVVDSRALFFWHFFFLTRPLEKSVLLPDMCFEMPLALGQLLAQVFHIPVVICNLGVEDVLFK